MTFKKANTWIFVFTTIFFKTSCLLGQVTSFAEYGNVFPPTPEVAAIGKYFETPVGYSTGTPNINIPLHTIKSGNLEQPISLSYNASGIKVEEVATWVGLGWNLNTGGSLSRVVNGLPDDIIVMGYMHTQYTVARYLRLAKDNPEKILIAELMGESEVDMEPDMFIFSAGNYSGKFYFNQYTKEFVQTPYQNIRIFHQKNADSNIISFRLITPDGNNYFFGKSKDGLREGYDKLISNNTTNTNGGEITLPQPFRDVPVHINNWMLMDIESATGSSLKFEYEKYFSMDFGRGGEFIHYEGSSGCDQATDQINAGYYKNNFEKCRVTSIAGINEIINFKTLNEKRQDLYLGSLSPDVDNRALGKIEIKNIDNELIRAYELFYHFSESNDSPWIPGTDENATLVARKRLILDSLRFLGTTGNSFQRYSFEYESLQNLPSRLSTAQDYWGYFNGKLSNPSLLPAVRYAVFYNNPSGYMPGADRTVDYEAAKSGILKKINYPTGGYTIYRYESNTASAMFTAPFIFGFKPSGLIPKLTNFFKSKLYRDSLNPNKYGRTFSINNIDGEVNIQTQIVGCPDGINNVNCPIRIELINIVNDSVVFVPDQQNLYAILSDGEYKIEANISPFTEDTAVDFNVQLSWEENPDPVNAIVGGLRVKTIESNPGFGKPIYKSYTYSNFDYPAISSGALSNPPVHANLVQCGYGIVDTGIYSFPPSVLRISSSSVSALSSGDGQMIRYTNVSEFFDSSAQGFRTEYFLTNDQFTYVNPSTQLYPYPPHIKRDWRNGQLFSKRTFSKAHSGFEKLTSFDINSFDEFEPTFMDTFGIKIGMYPTQSPFPTFGISPYSFYSEWYLPVQSEARQYNSSNTFSDSLVSITKTDYNSKYQVKTTENTNSKNQKVISNFRYPYDFSNNSVFNEMVSRNILTPVVLQVDSNRTLNKEISRTVIGYRSWHSNKFILPDSIKKSIGGILLDIEGIVQAYDTSGNVLQLMGRDGVVNSIIWGYNSEYPVAKIVGKNYSEAISQSNIDLSILNNTSSSEQAKHSELTKLYNLSNCLITTYTYAPLVGVTSQTDPAGRTSFYEYDASGKLMQVKDQNGNIIKKYCYNYANQIVNCETGQ